MKVLRFLGITAAVLAVIIVGIGQAGMLTGSPATPLGVVNGRLQPPSMTANSVSSQANLYPDHPQRSYAQMAPLAFSGRGPTAMHHLAEVLRGMDQTTVVIERDDYLYAQSTTPWLKFTDDIEFWLDGPTSTIQFRSASRLGRKDFGVNRTRMETIRALFTS